MWSGTSEPQKRGTLCMYSRVEDGNMESFEYHLADTSSFFLHVQTRRSTRQPTFAIAARPCAVRLPHAHAPPRAQEATKLQALPEDRRVRWRESLSSLPRMRRPRSCAVDRIARRSRARKSPTGHSRQRARCGLCRSMAGRIRSQPRTSMRGPAWSSSPARSRS